MEDVRDLHTRFLQAREMMKSMGDLMGSPAKMARAQSQNATGTLTPFPGLDREAI